VKFQAARVRTYNPEFMVVYISAEAMDDDQHLPALLGKFESRFNGAPVVLMARNANGSTTFCGKTALVNYLKAASADQVHLTWETWQVNEDLEALPGEIGNNFIKGLFGIAANALGLPGPPSGI
jgi:hypothetical protein